MKTKLQEARLRQIIQQFSHIRILVVGDIMLDEYILGEAVKISPEAPVPVIRVKEKKCIPGGASNVALSIKKLGASVEMIGAIGQDPNGQILSQSLLDWKINTSRCLWCNDQRPTTTKTRIIAQHQQVVRVDNEQTCPFAQEELQQIQSHLRACIPQCHAVIVSDYAKGFITSEIMDTIRQQCALSSTPIVVDPKPVHGQYYHNTTLLTPNLMEASEISGVSIHNEISLLEAGRQIIQRLQCPNVLITRGEGGMTLFQANQEPLHIPTVAQHVYDVTGAGDMVVGTVTLGICAGLDLEQSAILANVAAGKVVSQLGVYQLSPEELLTEFQSFIQR